MSVDLSPVIGDSVQAFPKPTQTGLMSLYLWMEPDGLPPYGTRSLDKKLREWSRRQYNTLYQSTKMTLAKRVASTPWEISGTRGLRPAQAMLQSANFGDGWRDFVLQLVGDFCDLTAGAFIEVIGAGNADEPLVGMPTGVAALDPLRCWLTGNPEHPVAYQPYYTKDGQRNTSLYYLHRTRVVRIVDMPTSEEGYRGYGESALYRFWGFVQKEVLMGRYHVERLSDMPPTGLVKLSNVPEGKWEELTQQYEASRKMDGQSVFRNLMEVESAYEGEIDIEFIPFSVAPENFDYQKQIETDVRMIALAFGLDPQDVWPLTGQLAGTASQSEVLAAKNMGKSIGDLLNLIETIINTRVLPANLEFKFKREDAEGARGEAERTKIWIEALGLAGLNEEQRLRALASVSSVIADAVTDADGTIKLPSDDVREPEQIAEGDEQTADNTTLPGTDEDAAVAPSDSPVTRQVKAYRDTRREFVDRVEDAIRAGINDDVTRRRFGILMRGHLDSAGRRAYLDGLNDGGVQVDVLDGDDQRQFRSWLAEQSAFVTQLGQQLYQDGATPNAQVRADMWANKSLNRAYQLGLLSANKNALYRWRLGPTEHCDTCFKAAQQIHRLSTWDRNGIMPKSDRLICGGYNCQCRLERTQGRAKGRISRIPTG